MIVKFFIILSHRGARGREAIITMSLGKKCEGYDSINNFLNQFLIIAKLLQPFKEMKREAKDVK